MKKLKVAGLNFDHMHMGDLLRKCYAHPDVEIVGICDDNPVRMQSAAANFQIPRERIFTDPHRCLETTEPDFVILCPATARHAEYVELVAPYRVHILVEKPFAATLREADRMIAAAKKSRRLLAINWPLRWSASHVTAYRILREGGIGALQEVHYYGGNRGYNNNWRGYGGGYYRGYRPNYGYRYYGAPYRSFYFGGYYGTYCNPNGYYDAWGRWYPDPRCAYDPYYPY